MTERPILFSGPMVSICPRCGRRHECEWDGIGWWWIDWPCECGATPMVESDCEFLPTQTSQERPQ